MTNQERMNDILKALNLGYLHLNDWEQEFVNDTNDKWILKDKKLNWPHQKKLIEIWEKIE